jgi:TetR/AcrR family transcriptional regulator
MIENFLKIPKAEQQLILKVALQEFAGKGYLRASTNVIVRKAGIPKGTLFYYFGSKKAMYLYVLDWAVNRFIEVSQISSSVQPGELFENLLYRSSVKLQFIREEPMLYRFFYRAFLEIPEELKEDMNSRVAAYSKASKNNVLENIDRSLFRENVDIEAAIRMIHLLLDGLLNHYTPLLNQMGPDEGLKMLDNFEAECHTYFDMIKKGIYR